MPYLDYAASAPLRAEALAAMLPLLERPAANPSSQHGQGRAARAAVETAREQVAALVGAAPGEVVFTSGGTEADNLAVKGTVLARPPEARHLVCSAVEHHAVLDAAAWAEADAGARSTWPRWTVSAGSTRTAWPRCSGRDAPPWSR